MITNLDLNDFRGMRDWQPGLPLKPITLLFGPNSAGKSTVAHGLAYLREVFERHNLDADITRLGGDGLDLGGFGAMVHEHDLDRVIRIGVTFNLEEDLVDHWLYPREGVGDDEGTAEGVRKILRGDVELAGADGGSKRLWFFKALCESVSAQVKTVHVSIGIGWSRSFSAPQVIDYRVGLNGHYLGRIEATPDGRGVRVAELQLEHGCLRPDPEGTSLVEQCIDWSDVEARGGLGVVGVRSALPTWDSPLVLKTSAHVDDPVGWSSLQALLDLLLVAPGRVLRQKLLAYRYVGPLREVPARRYTPPRSPDESRWATGIGAWDALERDAPLREGVSSWLSGPLRAGYVVDWVAHREIPEELARHLMEVFGGVEVRDENAESTDVARLNEIMATGERGARLVLRRAGLPESALVSATKLGLHPRDVGIGISQVVPVIAASLDSFVHVNGQRLPVECIIIEQPELHVHPATQVGLGDLFIQASRTRQVVVETHSEHLLLRLLRRIRETTDGTCEAGFELTPKDLCILYAESTDSGYTRFRQLRVDETGEFIDPWPNGFFAERDPELFG